MTGSKFLLSFGLWWAVFLFAAFAICRFRLAFDTLTRKDTVNPWAIRLVLLFPAILALPYLSSAVGTGDAAFYNTQIESVDLYNQYIHFGYYLIGVALHFLVPMQIDLLMNVASYIQGIAITLLLFSIFRYHGASSLVAALAAATFSSTPVAIYSYVYSEVYVTGLFLCLLSYWLLIRRLAPLAGLSFALALTVSILNIVFAPLFIYATVVSQRMLWTRALIFSFAVAVPIGIFMMFYGEGLLYGDRGILTGAGAAKSITALAQGWVQSIKILLGSFPILLPIFVLAAFGLIRFHGLKKIYVLLPVALTVIVHALTAGALLEWGLDLLITPLLCLLLAQALMLPNPIGVFVGISHAQKKVILLAALICNSACGLMLWTDGFLTEAKEHKYEYERLGVSLGKNLAQSIVPLGGFSEKGKFLRAQSRPYIATQKNEIFDPNATEIKYLVLNQDEKLVLESRPDISAWKFVQYELNDNIYWILESLE